MDGPGLESRWRQAFSPFSTTSRPALGLSNAYRSSLPGIKRPRHEVNLSPPFSADVKNEWAHSSTPTICLHDVDKDEFHHNKKKSSDGEKLKPFLTFLLFFSLSPFFPIFLSFPVSVPYFVCSLSLLISFSFSFFRPPTLSVFFLHVDGLHAFHITMQTFAALTQRCNGSLQSLCLCTNSEALW